MTELGVKHDYLYNQSSSCVYTLMYQRLASTDTPIDAVVYELYGLMDEEIKLVERCEFDKSN